MLFFRMKNDALSDNLSGLEGYVNHGMSRSNVDLSHSYGSFHNSHENHQGSSDFICKSRKKSFFDWYKNLFLTV